MYSDNAVVGVVKRKDGYWWVKEDGTLTSLDSKVGGKLLAQVRDAYRRKTTPYFSECLGYVTSYLKHRAASALYALGKTLTG